METKISPEPGEEGNGELTKKLELRRQVPLVVGKPEKEHSRSKRHKAQGMRPHPRPDPATARHEDIDEKRPKKPEEKRGTSAAGNRNLVYAARIWLVDHTEAAVYLAHYRGQHERQRKRREEDYGERGKPLKKIHHFALPPSSSILDRR